jgi:hypothetical protein
MNITHTSFNLIFFGDNDHWEERQAFVKIYEQHLELEMGVIPHAIVSSGKGSIDNALLSMTPEDARKTKRAWRKQVRRVRGNKKPEKFKSIERSGVFIDIRSQAHSVFDQMKSSQRDSESTS